MKFSDFSNTTLNTEEIQKLEKRGFYVKTILPFTSLFLTILGYIPYTPITAALMILPTLFIVLFTKSQSIITILCFLLFPTLWIFYKASYDFIFYSKQFFYKK